MLISCNMESIYCTPTVYDSCFDETAVTRLLKQNIKICDMARNCLKKTLFARTSKSLCCYRN